MLKVDRVNFTSFYNDAAKLLEMYKQELETEKVNASGTLSDTADFDVDFDDNHITLYFNLAIWWYYVEKGRKPTGGGMGQSWTNSIEELELWIKNKISRGYWIPKPNQTIPNPNDNKQLKRIAYSIRHKIHTEGWYTDRGTDRGLHLLKRVLDRAEASGLIQKMIDSVVQGYEDEVQVELQKI